MATCATLRLTLLLSKPATCVYRIPISSLRQALKFPTKTPGSKIAFRSFSLRKSRHILVVRHTRGQTHMIVDKLYFRDEFPGHRKIETAHLQSALHGTAAYALELQNFVTLPETTRLEFEDSNTIKATLTDARTMSLVLKTRGCDAETQIVAGDRASGAGQIGQEGTAKKFRSA
ncbi:hypothetical protein FB451DRAFT_1162035 [Mycena latifolia]|nr:hypothetical protein FB451DRAFT_1162035 [Mycena latifolia]